MFDLVCAVCGGVIDFDDYKVVGHDRATPPQTVYAHRGECYERRAELWERGFVVALPSAAAEREQGQLDLFGEEGQ